MEINKNRNAICGINITIPPMPGIIPSESKFVNTPLGNESFVKELNLLKALSIASIG